MKWGKNATNNHDNVVFILIMKHLDDMQ